LYYFRILLSNYQCSLASGSGKLGKVTANNANDQTFVQVLTSFSFISALLAAYRACFPKASAKLQRLSVPSKFFSHKMCFTAYI